MYTLAIAKTLASPGLPEMSLRVIALLKKQYDFAIKKSVYRTLF